MKKEELSRMYDIIDDYHTILENELLKKDVPMREINRMMQTLIEIYHEIAQYLELNQQ